MCGEAGSWASIWAPLVDKAFYPECNDEKKKYP